MGYWLATLALIVLGFLAMFSVGWMLLVVGLAMTVLAPLRHRPAIYWPPMAAVLAFLVGYLAVAPLSCFATAEPPGAVSPVICSSLLGVQYTGTTPYTPSQLPGLAAGLLSALAAACLVGLGTWLRRRRRADRFLHPDDELRTIYGQATAAAGAGGTDSIDLLTAALAAPSVAELIRRLGADPRAIAVAASTARPARQPDPGLTDDAKRVVETVGQRSLARRRNATAVDLLVALTVVETPVRGVLAAEGLDEPRVRAIAG